MRLFAGTIFACYAPVARIHRRLKPTNWQNCSNHQDFNYLDNGAFYSNTERERTIVDHTKAIAFIYGIRGIFQVGRFHTDSGS